jgi:hypothetical protein
MNALTLPVWGRVVDPAGRAQLGSLLLLHNSLDATSAVALPRPARVEDPPHTVRDDPINAGTGFWVEFGGQN